LHPGGGRLGVGVVVALVEEDVVHMMLTSVTCRLVIRSTAVITLRRMPAMATP